MSPNNPPPPPLPSLRLLRRSFRKSVSIYPRSAPGISLTKHQATDTRTNAQGATFELGGCNKMMVLSTKLNEFTIVKTRSKRLLLKRFAVVKTLYHIS